MSAALRYFSPGSTGFSRSSSPSSTPGAIGARQNRPCRRLKSASIRLRITSPNLKPAPCGAAASSLKTRLRDLLIVTQDLRGNRGRIERAFLRATGAGSFEFSLGVPLSLVPLPRAALLLLRWFSVPLAEHELDWLFSSGYISGDSAESRALQARMRALRRKDEQQPAWALEAWLARSQASARHDSALSAWIARLSRAHHLVSDRTRNTHTALEWSEFVPQWLESIQFAVGSPLTSAEFQALRRWQAALELTGSVGFDGRRISYDDFLALLSRAFDETVFALESRDAPIQITGPAESAAIAADAVWFLGATEDAWPASGTTHPLLPLEVQREAEMPHADPRLDWTLCQSITTRLLQSAAEGYFSYARQSEAAETLPSRLIQLAAGPPEPLPPALAAKTAPTLRTVIVEDFSQIPFQPGKVPGGASVLTLQSQCPFQAFAVARLSADDWEPAQAGLTPAQRGQLLHAVLHRLWAELRSGSPALDELQVRGNRDQFTAKHVRQVFLEELKPALAGRMPARYLQLEQERLTRLVSAWLEIELSRVAFAVLETEARRTVSIAGLTFDLRLDRIDRLNDDSLLVIDYKTGDLKPKIWELPRPEDIQLPLYAGFALPEDSTLGGLVFAKIRPGKSEFSGHLRSASTTLSNTLHGTSALVRNPLTLQQLSAWRDKIEELARAFLAGRAEVDPREFPRTCERCGLQTLCRINEVKVPFESDDEPGAGSAFAEMPDA